MTNSEAFKLYFQTFETESESKHNASPIIFIHGIYSSHKTWSNITQKIADGTKRKVYSYDSRNHGDSSFTEEYSPELNIEDLFYFMDTQNISKAILVGHSMGGYTALRAAIKEPERVEMLFVEDMYAKYLSRDILYMLKEVCIAASEAAKKIPKDFDEAEAVQFASNWLYEKVPCISNGLARNNSTFPNILKRQFDGTYTTRFNAHVILDALKRSEDLPKETNGQYDGPSYFIYNTKSPLNVRSHEEDIKMHFPNVQFVVFEGGCHDIHGEFPEKYVQILLDRIPH